MESNITKILIKKFWKRCVTLPLNSLQRSMTLSFLCSLSTDDPPFCGPSPSSPPPPRKTYIPLGILDLGQWLTFCINSQLVPPLLTMINSTISAFEKVLIFYYTQVDCYKSCNFLFAFKFEVLANSLAREEMVITIRSYFSRSMQQLTNSHVRKSCISFTLISFKESSQLRTPYKFGCNLRRRMVYVNELH